MKNFIRDGIMTSVTEILIVFLEVIPAALLARALGVEGRGVYAVIILIYSTLLLIAKGGVDVAIVYYWGKSEKERKQILLATILIALIFSLVTLVGFGIIYQLLSNRYFKQINSQMLWPVIALVPFSVLSDFLTQVVLAQKKIVWMNINRLLVSLFYATSVLGFYFLGGLNLTVAVLVYILMLFFSLLLNLRLIRAEISFKLSGVGRCLRQLISFGLKLHLGTLLYFLMSRVNVYLLVYFSDAAAVGILSVALIIERVTLVSGSFGRIFLTKMAHEKNTLSAAAQTAKLSRCLVLVMGLIMLAIFAIRYYIIGIIYGDEFTSAVGALVLLLPGVFALTITQGLNPYLYGFKGRSGLFSQINLVAFIVAGSIGYWLIPTFGANGAAAALSAGYLIYFSYTIYSVRRISQLNYFEYLIIKGKDLSDIYGWIKPYLLKVKYVAEKITFRGGSETARFVLSFDLDLEADYRALPWLLNKLKQAGIKASFACIGKFVERYPEIHQRIINDGHEIVNHTDSHPDHAEFFPNKKFNEITKQQRQREIIQADRVFKKYLNYQAVGFRAPHFAFVEDIYPILTKIGYRYSSSQLAWRSGTYGTKISYGKIKEWPLSADEDIPWQLVDTYTLFRGTSANKKLNKIREQIIIKKLDHLLRATWRKKCFATVFFDPVDVKKMKNFDRLLKVILKYQKKGIKIIRYEDLK